VALALADLEHLPDRILMEESLSYDELLADKDGVTVTGRIVPDIDQKLIRSVGEEPLFS